MSVHSATIGGRLAAEARMLDSCDIGVLTEGPPDPVTLEPTQALDAHYSGKCRISSTSNAVSEGDAGGQSFADQSFILSVPIASAGDIKTDDSLVVTGVDPVSGNPAMVGLTFRVAGLASLSQATAARFALELIS